MDKEISTAAGAVIVGAGLAGIVTALRCAELGVPVELLEASPQANHLNSTRASGGVFHLGFRSMREDPKTLENWLVEATQGFVARPLAAAMSSTAGRAAEWLAGQGIAFGTIEPTDGWRDTVTLPHGYYDGPGLRWQGSGSDRMMDTLTAQLAKRGVRIRSGARAVGLHMQNGRCGGVRIADGRVFAAPATVLADGGFESSPELLRRFVTPHPERLKQRNAGTGGGDGIRMAEEAGAELVGMRSFYGHLLSADALHDERLWPFPFLDFLAGSGVLVDRHARRFADEGLGGVWMANAVAQHADAEVFFAVFDAEIWGESGRHFFRPPNPNLVKYGGTLLQANTLTELAGQASLPAESLQTVVAAHNAAVERDAFSALAPPRSNAKRTARRIATPPFYAAPGCVGITHTMGGVRIDAHGRALRRDGGPIPGLYAVGNVAGGLDGGPRNYYAGGLALALILGLLAAESIGAPTGGAP